MNRISLKRSILSKEAFLFNRNFLVPESPKKLKLASRKISCSAGVQYMRCMPGILPRVANVKWLWWQCGEGAQINPVNIRDKSVPWEETERERWVPWDSCWQQVLSQDSKQPKKKEVRGFIMLDTNLYEGFSQVTAEMRRASFANP